MPDPVRAAGVVFVAPDGDVLMMRKPETGEWSFPGGHLESGETFAEAAAREAAEETGRSVEADDLKEWTRRIRDGVDYVTFLSKVDVRFEPELSDEHDAFRWVYPKDAVGPADGAVSAPEAEARLRGAPVSADHEVTPPDTDAFASGLRDVLDRIDEQVKWKP